MSVSVADLVASLRGEDMGFSALMDGAGRKLEGLGHHSESTMAKISNVGLAVGALAVGIAGASIKSAADYQELTTALVTGAGESVKNLELVRQGMLTLAPKVGEGPDALAKAMYPIESAGFHGAAGLQVLEASAKGAKVGMADQADVANGLTTVLKDYHLKASDAAGVTGQMVAAVAAGKMHMGDFSTSLAKVLPIASAMHISFQQVAAAEAVMTAHGVDSARAATAIQAGLMQLINPSAKAQAAMRALHLPIKEMQNDLATGNLTGALGLIEKSMKGAAAAGMTQADQTKNLVAMFGGVRGGALALNLIPNMTEYKHDLKTVGDLTQGQKNLAKNWALTQEDLNVQLSKFQASIGVIGITIGTMLLPPMTQIATTLTPIVTGLANFASGHRTAVEAALAVGVAIGGIALAMKAVSLAKGPFDLALKLVTLGHLGGGSKSKGGGVASDILGGMKTAVMNVHADIVNINKGGGDSLPKQILKDTPVVLTAVDIAAMAGIAVATLGGVAGVAFGAKALQDRIVGNKVPNDLVMHYMQVTNAVGLDARAQKYEGSLSQTQQTQLAAIIAQANKQVPHFNDLAPTLQRKIDDTMILAIQKAGGPGAKGAGASHVTVNVNAGAVVMHGASNDPTVAKQIAHHLSGFVQQALSAAKSTPQQAIRSLPGVPG